MMVNEHQSPLEHRAENSSKEVKFDDGNLLSKSVRQQLYTIEFDEKVECDFLLNEIVCPFSLG
jgi:hypothetical protein